MKYVGLLLSVVATAFSVALFSTLPASADSASFCAQGYSQSGDPAYSACVAGYERGNDTSPICGREFTQPVTRNGVLRSKDELVAACQVGWNQYQSDRDACNSQQDPDNCKDQLRSSGAPGAIAPPPESGESSNKPPIGPAPTSADIDDYKSPDGPTEYRKCGIEGFFGTLLCGATATMGKMTDAAFHFLEIFLKAPPLITQNEQGEPTAVFQAASNFRNLANVAFVIAFLVVIYSHITNMGVSNYNVKKIVPRFIIGAVLVNMSFYICALLVDLSNILGGTLIDTLGTLVPPAPVGETGFSTWEQVTGSTLLVGGSVIAAGAAALFLNFSVLVPILTSALIAAVVTLLILILRQALIVVFVIIAPLAFAAILLPGTKSWFEKWRGAFIPLLMLYPVVALVYGGSQIAAVTVQRVGAAQGEVLLSIFSLGIQVVPLLITPFIMKLGGGIINRFAGTAENVGVARGARKKADDFARLKGEQRDARALTRKPSKWNKLRNARDRTIQRRVEREKKSEMTKENLSTAQTLHVAGYVENADDASIYERGKERAMGLAGKDYAAKSKNDKYLESLAQSSDPDAKKRAEARIIKITARGHISSVKAMSAQFELAGTSRNDLLGTATGQNAASDLEREAAIMRLCVAGDMGAIIQILKSSKSMNKEQRQMLVNSVQKHAGSAPFLGNQRVVDNLVQHGVGIGPGEGYVPTEAEQASMSPEELNTHIQRQNQLIVDKEFAELVIAPSVGSVGDSGSGDDFSAQTMVDIDKDAVAEIVKAVGNEENSDLFDAEALADLKLAAYDALSHDHTDSRVSKQREELSILARDHQQEEAIVQNRLFDMQNRGDDEL